MTTWFVQSRGRLPTQDYSWTPVRPQAASGLSPDALLAQGCAGRSIGELIDDSKPSLLLYALRESSHRQQVWVLLMTGLSSGETAAERDHMNRDIRVLVLGVGTGPHPPHGLTAVASLFLTGGLRAGVPVSYGLEGAAGYAVDAEAWGAVVERATRFDVPPADRVPGKHMVVLDRDSPANRRRAAGMLSHAQRCFAQGTFEAGEAGLVGRKARPLLVVTTLLGRESLKTLRPWYGLSQHVGEQQVVGLRRALGDSVVDCIKGVGSVFVVFAVLTVLAAACAMSVLLW
ncbi:hypothetical protein JK359_17025 [Streptomyces actinomycinicus]|uniref:Uncharacterized protein n=1 Tax=Streptomyces actinomycinicus TaxID=1695166 RepID=A0A937JMM2_9ACTN|nr:hypothetical protein [Streptomyces actinomycinicus]MBL1083650.1 hypothetical protein [Streptomyces actinomycinicus]